MKVIVTDFSNRSALTVMRSLGRQGVEVIGFSSEPQSANYHSRYFKRLVVHQSLKYNYHDFLQKLLALIQKEKIDLILPMSDETVVLCLNQQAEIEEYSQLFLPALATVKSVLDKKELARLCQRLAIPTPQTFMPASEEEFNALLERDLSFPLIVRPAISAFITHDQVSGEGPVFVGNKEELAEAFWRLHQITPWPFIQEPVWGHGAGGYALCDQGKIVAVMAQKRLRELRYTGAASTLRKSFVSEQITQDTIKLLTHLKWHGPAMVEFKYNETTGQYCVIEINPRFWGSLALTVGSGYDYPWWLCQIIKNQKIILPPTYRSELKYRWLEGDIYSLRMVFKGIKNKVVERPSRLLALLNFLKFYEPGLHYDYLTLDDPRPFFWNLFYLISKPTPGLKCLLHLHSEFSYDGFLSWGKLLQLLDRKNYQAVFLTDHLKDLKITDAEYLKLFLDPRCVPGYEAEFGPWHLLACGIKTIYRGGSLAEFITLVHQEGGVVILAHPPVHLVDSFPSELAEVDFVEIWNIKDDTTLAPNWRRFKFYQQLKKLNDKILPLGGLDAHNGWQIGKLDLYIQSPFSEPGELIKALKAGKYQLRGKLFSLSPDFSLTLSKKIIFDLLFLANKFYRRLIIILARLAHRLGIWPKFFATKNVVRLVVEPAKVIKDLETGIAKPIRQDPQAGAYFKSPTKKEKRELKNKYS